MIVSLVMGILGFYFLKAGKKRDDVSKMLMGAALIVGSYWLF